MLNIKNCIMSAIILCCSPLQVDAAIANPVNIVNPIYFIDYLNQTASKLDIYFTVEDDNEILTTLSDTNIKIENDPAIKTMSALIKKLHKDQSVYSVFVDEKNHQIIHLVDKRLLSQEEYALNQKSSILFIGHLSKLPNDIEQKTHLSLITQNTFLSNSHWIYDSYTTVSINAKNLPIRSILTDYIPLKNYSRYLWHSETAFHIDQPCTQISFYGPIPTKITSPAITK